MTTKDNLARLGISFYFEVIKNGIDYDVRFTQKRVQEILGISEYHWRKHYNSMLQQFRIENKL